ncbi:MAG TPA: hypothetical protein DD738_04050 [Ruminiclostridium sp.]|nr:hypothetical protein [Ruminiclostridium sp.]
MTKKKKIGESGNTTLECAILLPLVFACVFAVIVVFLALYQKSLIQGLAEDSAESLSRQWQYSRVSEEEIKAGVYLKETFKDREIYWDFKIWNNNKKANWAEDYIKSRIEGLGPLRVYDSQSTGEKGASVSDAFVKVEYQTGLTSVVNVDIKVWYRVPGAGLLKLVGFGDHILVQGRARAQVYNTKDMINSADFVLQILRESKTYELFMKKASAVKESIDNVLSK